MSLTTDKITSSGTSRVQQQKCGASAHITTPAATTVTSAGTYYPILGTFSNPNLEQFEVVADPAIKYTGPDTMDFEVDWHATISCNNASRHVTIAIKKNADVQTSSVMGTTLKTAGDKYALSGTCVVSLTTNDKIQLVLTSDNNGDEMTAHYFTTTIKPFFL